MVKLLAIIYLASAINVTVGLTLSLQQCRDKVDNAIRNVTTQYNAARVNPNKANELMPILHCITSEMITLKHEIAEKIQSSSVSFQTRFNWTMVEKRACSFSWILQNYINKQMDDLGNRHMILASGHYNDTEWQLRVESIHRQYPSLSNRTMLEYHIKELDNDIHTLLHRDNVDVDVEKSDSSVRLISQLQDLYQKSQDLYMEWEVLLRVQTSVANALHQYFPIQYAIDAKAESSKFFALSQMAFEYKTTIQSAGGATRLSTAILLVSIMTNLYVKL